MATWKLNYLKVEDNVARLAKLTAVDPDDDTVDQVDSNFPLSNMQILPVSKPGRIWNRVSSSGTGSMNLQVSFPAAQSINVIALVGHNLSSSATITLNGGSAFNPTSSQGTMTWRRNIAWHYFSAAKSYKYWNIEISDNANKDGFAQIGYLVMGTLTELDFGFSISAEFIDEVLGLRVETETGVPLNRHIGERYRMLLEFHDTSTNVNSLRSLFFDLLGPNEPALWVPYTAGTEAAFGRLNQDSFQRVYSSPDTITAAVEIVDDPGPIAVIALMPILRESMELPATSSFTRQTAAQYKNEHLELVEAGSGVLRTGWLGNVAGITTTSGPHYHDYDKHGTLLEPARTNAIFYGQNLSGYTKAGVYVTSASVNEPKVSPSGIAWKISEQQLSGTHYIYSSAIEFAADTVQAISVFTKAEERTSCRFHLRQGDDFAGISADLSAGTITSYSGGSAIVHSTEIEKYGNSWYRLKVGVQLGSGADSGTSQIHLKDATGSATYSGVSGYGLYAWNFQHEVDKSFPSSPIYTSGAVATRNADVLYVPFDFDTQAFSFFIKYTALSNAGSADGNALAHVGSSAASSDPRFYLRQTAINDYLQATFDDGITTIVNNGTNAVSIGDIVEVLGVLYPDGSLALDYSINGAAVVQKAKTGSNVLGSAFAADILYLNRLGSTDTYCKPNLIQEVKVYRGVQTLAFMREL